MFLKKVKNELYTEKVKSLSPLRIEIYKSHRNKFNNILRRKEKSIMKHFSKRIRTT